MKKVLYIFLAHVVVLGSIWLWKDPVEEDFPTEGQRHEPGQPVSLMVMNNDATDFRILICIDEDELGKASPGQMFNIFMLAKEDEKIIDLWGFKDRDSHTCYSVRLNESDPGCVVLTSKKENIVEKGQ
jgi:hypothetical protein